MDWYTSAKKIVEDKGKILIITDLIESEGFARLVNETDHVHKLYIIDKFLLKKQSRIGDIWRNMVKLIFLPVPMECIIFYSHICLAWSTLEPHKEVKFLSIYRIHFSIESLQKWRYRGHYSLPLTLMK
jgi:hypothetical protein